MEHSLCSGSGAQGHRPSQSVQNQVPRNVDVEYHVVYVPRKYDIESRDLTLF
jgi:hypothetical protein